MIKLVVEEYCRNCQKFEPTLEGPHIFGCGRNVIVDTFIHCEHAEMCREIMNYLKSKYHGGLYDNEK